jgi:hypothetical protein
MLKNTFLHIPGIGIKTEQRFWETGIHNWNDFTPDYPIHLPLPVLPENPFRVDTETVERVKIDAGFGFSNYYFR